MQEDPSVDVSLLQTSFLVCYRLIDLLHHVLDPAGCHLDVYACRVNRDKRFDIRFCRVRTRLQGINLLCRDRAVHSSSIRTVACLLEGLNAAVYISIRFHQEGQYHNQRCTYGYDNPIDAINPRWSVVWYWSHYNCLNTKCHPMRMRMISKIHNATRRTVMRLIGGRVFIS